MLTHDHHALPNIFTIAELQTFLHIGRSTAYRLVSDGSIKSIRIGRNIRIPQKFVLDFIITQQKSLENASKLCYNYSVTARSGLSKESEVKS